MERYMELKQKVLVDELDEMLQILNECFEYSEPNNNNKILKDCFPQLICQKFLECDINYQKFMTIWDKCCNQNYLNLYETALLLETSLLSNEEIHENLDQEAPVPFVTVLPGLIYDEENKENRRLNPSDEEWEDYASTQIQIFRNNMNESHLKR